MTEKSSKIVAAGGLLVNLGLIICLLPIVALLLAVIYVAVTS